MATRLGRNDSCHCGSGKKYKLCHLEADVEARRMPDQAREGVSSALATLSDPRSMERTLGDVAAFVGGGRRRGKRSPVERAQALVYDAWEAPDPARSIALAREALAVSRNCADAWVLLAEELAESVEEARDLYARGVEAGERSLGGKAFEEDAGHFWGILETRPYMRARYGLAQCLWLLGEGEAAVGHYQDLLRLNPNDNQGIRYELAACLLHLGRDDSLAELLERYQDDASAAWAFSGALLAYRRSGDGEASQEALATARRRNPHVCAYLLGAKRLPRDLPAYIGFGDESEAIAYTAEQRSAWTATSGALEWLATATGAVTGQRKMSKTARR